MSIPRRVALILVVLACTASTAQARGFSVFANAFLDSTRTPRTRVTAEVPFSSLIFFKKQGVYTAEYDVYIEVWPEEEDVAHGTSYVLHGAATVQSYEETKKRDTRSRSWREFSLAPGDYVVEATLRVKGTRIGMRREVKLRVPDYLSSGIGFGTPQVMMVPSSQMKAFAAWRDFRNVAAVARPADVTLAMFDRQPAVRFALFFEKPISQPVSCDFFYEVRSPRGDQVLYGKRELRLTGNNDEYVIGFNVDDWRPGTYAVNMRVVTHDPERDATTSVPVKVDVTRAMLTTGFDETMTIMSIVFSRDELKGLREASESERPVEWAKFWSERDPDPTTPENEALQDYVDRLNYVSQHFSQVGPGWRSDRGQVYIKYGKPDEVDRAADQRQQGEYEIWRYHGLNRTFVFYDMFGVGDFKLVEGEMF